MSTQKTQHTATPHQFLSELVGSWAGTTLTWPEPGGVPRQAQTQGSIQLVLGGRFALYLYQTGAEGEPQHGVFTFGYNTTLDRWEASWIDSFHNNTAIMFCVGQARDHGFFVQGNYPDPTGGPDWSWRTEVSLVDRQRLVITAYNISPEGAESKAVETHLARAK